MKMRSLLTLGLTLCFATAGTAFAQKMPRESVVGIPAIPKGFGVSNAFQSNMVLQRDKPIKIWGWAAKGEKITVSFSGKSAAATADDKGMWEVELPTMTASHEGQSVTIKGKSETATLENVLIGDVWILGGQSNMEFALAKVDDGMIEIASANFPEIRLLTVPQGHGFDSVRSFERLHEWSSWSSRHFRKGDWVECSPQTVRDFSAIGYVFGRRIHMASRVPIGLIDVSRGGTTVEAWTPESVVKGTKEKETQAKLTAWDEKIAAYDPQADLVKRVANFERKKKEAAKKGTPYSADKKAPTDLQPGPKADQNRPGYCFAGMIKPIEGLSVKGAIFHQGYNNCFDGADGAKMYYQLFGKMITAWRSSFDDPKLPFGIISLCTGGAPQTEDKFLAPMYDIGALIREAQYQTFLDFRKAGDEMIGFASCYDFRKSWYHPQIKVPTGERIAKWAMATQYESLGNGSEAFWLPPTIEKMESSEGALRLTMSTPITMKDESTDKMVGFAIAGKDRRFYPAQIAYATDGVDNRNRPKLVKNMLVLSSPHVAEPMHYRYAWARNPLANLTSSRQIPLATQRSDDWLPDATPLLFPGADQLENQRQLSGMIRKELAFADTERQIKDAEATVAELKEKFLKDKEAWEKNKAKEAEKQAAR